MCRRCAELVIAVSKGRETEALKAGVAQAGSPVHLEQSGQSGQGKPRACVHTGVTSSVPQIPESHPARQTCPGPSVWKKWYHCVEELTLRGKGAQ